MKKKTVFLKTLIESLSWLISSSRIFSEFDADNNRFISIKDFGAKIKGTTLEMYLIKIELRPPVLRD